MQLRYTCITKCLSVSIWLLSMQSCVESSGKQNIISENNSSGKEPTFYDFNPSFFDKAAREFGPFTRWWWPGNDVENVELKREVSLFAENGFAGIEIQPFTYGLNYNGSEDRIKKQYSWDTQSFYDHLATVMDEAKKVGLIVDLTAGSGWPMGGPSVSPDSSLLTLDYVDTIISGGKLVTLNIPRLKPDSSLTGERRPGFMLYRYIDTSYAKLQAVIAAKFVKEDGNQVLLEEGSILDLRRNIVGDKISWLVPEGKWKLIACWSIPDGEVTKGMAAKPQGLVIDPLDSSKLKVFYEHLFGKRTGLEKYYGKPFRAVFNDSYEFLPDRHFSYELPQYFKKHRGYDLIPFLPVNFQKGYNSAYGPVLSPGQKPKFILSDEDWRLRYDYDLTISELLQSHFITASKNWLQLKGLLHRTQTYGAKMDVISNSGHADIPETEQLAGNNSEGFIKLVTSGAHLYNKPVISQESFVFMGHAETITPQKIKILADKSFAAGVNQIIYHGTPYKYQTGEFGAEGWSPFSSPFLPINFSATINESWPYWKNIRQINQYITRIQYALRSGKPKTDVVIYFPFIDFYPEQIANNPEEALIAGHIQGVEPEFQEILAHSDKTSEWFLKLWPIVNKLEAAGITWEFVNDAALQKAQFQSGKLCINGNYYEGLILSDIPYIQLPTAQKINDLSKKGCKLLFSGIPPSIQPSYLNWKINDVLTDSLIKNTRSETTVTQIKNLNDIDSWIKTILNPIRFQQNYSFTRQINREMSDGSRLQFIWNKSNKWETISLRIDSSFSNNFWINTEEASIIKNSELSVTYKLPPYGSVILFASKKKFDNLLYSPLDPVKKSKQLLNIKVWNLKVDDLVFENSKLFDWRSNTKLKYISKVATYTSSFTLEKKEAKEYFLDLGEVYFTAEVYINGKHAGERIWQPYRLELSRFIKRGRNTIEVRVIPTSRNKFIGEAVSGNDKYNHFKGKENTLMPAGLIGPVTINTEE